MDNRQRPACRRRCSVLLKPHHEAKLVFFFALFPFFFSSFSSQPVPSYHTLQSLSISAMQASRHEHPSKYAKGGFCPIELGDRIADRFTVLHKLGYGGFGTVWLVRDDAQRHGRRYVALKVLAAAYSTGDEPSVAVRRLREYERATGRGLFVLELERFFYASANGRHLCQVFPVLGPSLAALNGDKFLLRPSFVRPFSRQLVRAVDTMHSIGVCHGGESPPALFSPLPCRCADDPGC